MKNNTTTNEDAVSFWAADAAWGGAMNAALVHGVSRRTGGVSAGPYASLNLGFHVGDDAELVRENRRRAVAALGFEARQMVCAAQVHGSRVAVVTAPDAAREALAYEEAIPGVDALVTNAPGVLLALFFADCLPVLLADEASGAVAVAHAGWRGLDAGVIENTLQAMQTAYGTQINNVWAAVGPGIGPAHFEVGEEVAARFPGETMRAKGDGAATLKPHVDLPRAAARRLEAAGVLPARLAVCDECTASLPGLYFSHRRDAGTTGRMGAFIGLRS